MIDQPDLDPNAVWIESYVNDKYVCYMLSIDEDKKARQTLKIVEVFKTNVQEQNQSEFLLSVLCKLFPSHKINFDLSDCDNILRVEGNNVKSQQIIDLLHSNGYQCQVLI